eukprot:7033712-Pyramimonas_sp.AAC.1
MEVFFGNPEVVEVFRACDFRALRATIQAREWAPPEFLLEMMPEEEEEVGGTESDEAELAPLRC